MVGIAAVGIYLLAALSPMLFHPLQMTDLVLADSLKNFGHVLIMLWFIRRWGPLRGHGLETTILKSAGAASVMGLLLVLGRWWLTSLLPPSGLLNEVLLVTVLAGLGGVVYFAAIWSLKVEEIGLLVSAIKARF